MRRTNINYQWKLDYAIIPSNDFAEHQQMNDSLSPNTILDRHIIIDPNICHGKPHLAGHRIRVQDIALWHERLGISVAEICADYDLSQAEVYAALAYYFDYKTQIDQDIDTDQAYFEAFQHQNPSLLQQKLKDLRGQ
jgi:uncharacterized protein (DUF433 family)